jgi:FKBP-type peptidyl-prolyl cis-trans isomerase
MNQLLCDNNNNNNNSNNCTVSSTTTEITDDDDSNDNEKDLQYMLSCLSQDEIEIAAQTSYQYLRRQNNMKMKRRGGASTTSKSSSDNSAEQQQQQQEKHAKAMARRYLESKKEVEKALLSMRATLQFRHEMKLDRLMTIFDDSSPTESNNNFNNVSPTTTSSDDDKDHSDERFRSDLISCLSSKKNFVMGYDKQGRATFHFVLRQTQHHDPERTLLESIYTMERAIACTSQKEQQQQQQQLDNKKNQSSSSQSNIPHHDGVTTTTSSLSSKINVTTINAIIDCAGFNIWTQGPPLDVGQVFLQTLRQHYVGNFYRIFILDAPLGFICSRLPLIGHLMNECKSVTSELARLDS